MYSEEDMLMLSGIQHFAFCKRQWAMIHLEMQWEENERTARGKQVHKKVDTYRARESKKDMLILRSARVSSHELGLYGMCDVVEILTDANGNIRSAHPVEYKSGRPKENDCDRVQLCAQAIAIEEMMGINVPLGSIYYNEIRRRLIVQIDKELRDRTIELSKEMHEVFEQRATPKPRYGKWCGHCSLENICMPSIISDNKPVEEYLMKQL
ncbi:MAG: CRISPR-associated protein Cas4 [Methanomassiliicoccaceae archaeon]|nr:CRISPR-associated protein Cas4 [Methanomassiliicoccaceae archaeon]